MSLVTRKKPLATLLIGILFALLISLLFFSISSADSALTDPGATNPVAPAAVPQVNGLFYGDGDDANYHYLAEEPGRAKLYYYLENDTLYVAVVVDRAVNDNVFGDTGDATDELYLQSAGWSGTGSHHNFKALERSEHLDFSVTCAGGAIDESWLHGYVYDLDGDKDPYEEDWLSGPDDDSTGGPYPTDIILIDTASSLMWNLNNFADMNGSPAWDITLLANGDPPRTTDTTYKSPGGGAADDDVTDEVGYPPTGPITYDTVNGWEWPLVYEFSADISACAGSPLSLEVISAHNSPPKSGPEDIRIATYDFGDLPDSYGTTLANSGANHLIQLNGPQLGPQIDAEVDGQPTLDATGDDANNDDEDGVFFDIVNTDWTAGSGEMDFLVTGGDGCLDVWIDFADDANVVVDNGDGDFFDMAGGISEHVLDSILVSSSDPQPINQIFPLPLGINNETSLGVRTRITPRNAAGSCRDPKAPGGGIGPTDGAIGGEVEDNILQLPEVTSAGLSSVSGSSAALNGWWFLIAGLAIVAIFALAISRRQTNV